jgi:hypothetical protein
MKRSALAESALVISLLCAVCAWSGDDDLKPWEKLGISQTEWIMIRDNRISEDKVQVLLRSGIGIGEYVAKPWKELGLTERAWIAKRRSGLTNYDIELEAKENSTTWKTDSKSVLK